MLTSLGCFLQEKCVLEFFFNSEYCKNFKSTYFEEHLQTFASENVYETEKHLSLRLFH